MHWTPGLISPFPLSPSQIGPWSRIHRLRREGNPAADAQFVASGCKTATPLVIAPANGKAIGKSNGKVNVTAAQNLTASPPKTGMKTRRSSRNSENEPPAN